LLPYKRPQTKALLLSWLHQLNQCAKNHLKVVHWLFQWGPDVDRAVVPVDQEWVQPMHPHYWHKLPFSPSVDGAQHPSALVSPSFHLSASINRHCTKQGREVKQTNQARHRPLARQPDQGIVTAGPLAWKNWHEKNPHHRSMLDWYEQRFSSSVDGAQYSPAALSSSVYCGHESHQQTRNSGAPIQLATSLSTVN